MSRSFLANVPVIPVLFALGKEPDARGRYWCPFHYDERPGGKPSAEVDEDPTVFHCWSCGREATAPEVASEFLQIPVREATRWCLTVAGPLDVQIRKRVEVSPERLESEYKRHTEGIRYPRDVDPVIAFLDSRIQQGAYTAGMEEPFSEFWLYLVEEWGWRGDYHGRVVMPHRNESGTLTGIKWRVPPDWRKLHRPGSRFESLYGSWRSASTSHSVSSELDTPRENDGAKERWLVEGETDTAWAGFWLEPLGVRVRGLVGAGHRPREEHLDFFRGTRTVLVFDDIYQKPGSEAVDKWDAALDGVADEIIVVELPPKRDLSQHEKTPVEMRVWA